MKSKFSKNWLAAVFGASLAAGLGILLQIFSAGAGLVRLSYDLLLVSRGEVAEQEAVLVYLDENSHLKLHQSLFTPWDRALHAQLIERLTAAGAKAIVFDIVFSDPSPVNPAADERLANAIKTSGRVILGADNVPMGRKMKQAIPPFALLRENAAGVGSVELIADSDLIVREHTLEDQLPSLSWAAAEFLSAKATQQESLRYRRRWINYYGQPNFLPSKSYYEALDPRLVSDDFFRDKVVFVGARIMTKFAGERKDEYLNPFSFWAVEENARFTAGAEIQATACLNLLRGDWLARLPVAAERAVLLLVGLLCGYGLIRFRPVIAIGLATAGLALLLGLFQFLFRHKLIWFPWLIIVVQVGAALGWSIIFNSIQLYVQKRMYEYTLGLYLSPKLVKRFSRDASLLKPGAEEQMLTIFFSDIADFTSISQKLDSDALVQLMNGYFQTAISQCIHQTDGTVVKYIGDAIFALWNAPELQPDHALRGCEAALRFREQSARPIQGQRLHTRMGIHTGPARVGNFGGLERFDYTALGESVNLASRLEGLNKYLGTDCLISSETKAGTGDRLVTRLLGLFQLKGFDRPVEVHELVGWPNQAESTKPWRQVFAQALSNYNERNLEFAEVGFRETLELHPEDGPAKFYLAKLEELRGHALPEDWVTYTILREK